MPITPSITQIVVTDPRTGKRYTWTRDKGWSETPQLSLVTNIYTGQIDPYSSECWLTFTVYLSGSTDKDVSVYMRASVAGKTVYEETKTVSKQSIDFGFRQTGPTKNISFVPNEGETKIDIYVEADGSSDSVSVSVYGYKLKTFTAYPVGIKVVDLDTGDEYWYDRWTGWRKGSTRLSSAPLIPAGHRLRITAVGETYTDFPCTLYIYLKDSSGNILCQNKKSVSGRYDTITCDATVTMPNTNLTVTTEVVADAGGGLVTRNTDTVTIPVSTPPPTYTPTPAKVVRIDVTATKTTANVNESIDIVYTVVLDRSLQPGETIDADHYIEINGARKQITPIFMGSSNNLWSYKTSVNFSSPGTYTIRIGILYRGVKRG